MRLSVQSGQSAIVSSAFTSNRAQTQRQHKLLSRAVKGQSYNVEIECTEDEDPEGVFKRFRNSCNQAGMVYEARKRQYFENRQDIKKRKQQEKGMHKARAMREKHLVTYGDAHAETPPFTELFRGQDDIYDIIGSMSDSYDEDRSMFSRRQARNDSNGASANSLATSADIKEPAAEVEEPESDPNIISRSVASDGPVAENNGAPAEQTSKSKQRPKFETAKSRRAQVRSPAGAGRN